MPKTGKAKTLPAAGAVPGDLASQLNTDRMDRGMTWPNYAQHLGFKLSTIYKIARRATTRPHETTVHKITKRLAEISAAEGAAREVVPSGQRHPERSED